MINAIAVNLCFMTMLRMNIIH